MTDLSKQERRTSRHPVTDGGGHYRWNEELSRHKVKFRESLNKI